MIIAIAPGGPGSHAQMFRSRRAFDLQTGCTNWLSGTHRSRPRWPAPLVEPGAVFAHLLALRCRRVVLAGRGLVALGRRAQRSSTQLLGLYAISRSTAHNAPFA
jgi:hypothetical protein